MNDYAETTEAFPGEVGYIHQELVEETTAHASENVNIEPKIIKEGQLSFETDTLASTKSTLDQIVKQLGGYYSSEQEYHYTYRNEFNVVIRVPASNFEKLIEEIGKGVEHFDTKSVTAQDVTEEFIDLEARITIKKDTEQRYRELLQKANTVSEILEIEEQITNLRADIESLEGRLKYLKNRVGLSTLNVDFYVTIPGGPKDTYGHKFSQGFENGWDGFIMFFVALTHAWPFLLMGVITWIVLVKLLKRRKRRKLEKANK